MQKTFRIYRAKKEDAGRIAELAVLMWTEHTVDDLAEEFGEIVENGAVFLAEEAAEVPEDFVMSEDDLRRKEISGQKAVAFAQCQLRHDYVEGTQTSPVGYLEGIFVREEYRKQGLARKLLTACENWAREQGCTEFASDCELTNTVSQEFHKNLGFEEANRVVCFVKRLER